MPKEEELARQAKIPVLPVRFTGGVAATVNHTLHSNLNQKIERLQKSGSKMDEFAQLLIEIIYEQIELAESSLQPIRGT